MKEEDIKMFINTRAQLDEMYKEIFEMSKKKPDNPINMFKLNLINKILSDTNSVLKDEYKPFNDFETFDEADLPTNSDVIIILSQYQNAMENLRCDNLNYFDHSWYWVIDGKTSSIRTESPSQKFKR